MMKVQRNEWNAKRIRQEDMITDGIEEREKTGRSK
jgi:hypothetical protein